MGFFISIFIQPILESGMLRNLDEYCMSDFKVTLDLLSDCVTFYERFVCLFVCLLMFGKNVCLLALCHNILVPHFGSGKKPCYTQKFT